MSAINQNWYNSNATRRYPLDDNATGTGDDGATRLNDDIVVGLHLRWPRVAGQYAYLSGLTVTEHIVTVIILAADSPTSAALPTPLVSVTLPQPVTRYRYYNFDSLYPGAGGFIAFGDPSEPFSIRFSSPAQGLLAPKAARPYAKLPIPSMRKLGRADGLTGLITIRGDRDIEVVKSQVLYNDEEVDALVVRLVSPTTTNNVLSTYIGPCGSRPESRNCRKEGVETINGVGPDCHGNLRIAFRGFTVGDYQSCGGVEAGVTLDQSIGIDEVCDYPIPGRFIGRDYCNPEESESLSSLSLPDVPVPSVSQSSSSSVSSEQINCETLPFTDFFDGELHDSWVLHRGIMAFDSEESPGEPLSSMMATDPGALLLTQSALRQVLTWEDCGMPTAISKRVITHMQLTNQAARINGGLVLNYRLVDPFTNPHVEYFLLSLNRNDNRVQLLRFNGASFVIENSVAPPLPFSLNDWFRLEAEMVPFGNQVAITCSITNVSDPGWGSVVFTITTTHFGDAEGGYHGVGNNRAVTRFSHWRVEDV